MIVSQGVLHLPEKNVRDNFIKRAMQNTKVGGYNLIGVLRINCLQLPITHHLQKVFLMSGNYRKFIKIGK